MKILHVIPSLSAARGGPSAVAKVLTRAQAAVGHDVTIATTDDDGAGRRAVAAPSESADAGVMRRVFPRQTSFYTVSLPLAQWLDSNVHAFDAVHVHALFSFPSTAAAWAARRHGTPYVVRPLGTLNQWGMENRRPLFKKMSLAAVESRILRNAAAVHFTTEQERCEAALLGVAHRGVVVPNPVADVPAAVTAVPRDSNMVLFLGRVDRIKRIELLLAAMHRLPAGNVTARLVVAGPAEDAAWLSALRAQAEALRVRVEWAGAVDGAQKAALLRQAAVLVLPSHSENFGIAAAEAMAAGVPVVVTPGVALASDVERAGAGLVAKPDEHALSAAIARLLGDRQLAQCCGEAGRRLAAERYSAAAVAAQLVSLYQEVAGR